MTITNSYHSFDNRSYDNSSCDEVLLSRSEEWIENTDNEGNQIVSCPKPSNAFLGDPEKVNSAIEISIKSKKNTIASSCTKKEASETKHSNFLSHTIAGDASESKLIENTMSKLAEAIRGRNQAYSEMNQLRAMSELAKLLESEDTKSLLGKALMGDYNDLIEDAGRKGWFHIQQILICNAYAQPLRSNVNHNGNGNLCNYSHDNIEGKTFLSLSSESLYPFFPGDDNGTLLEASFLNTILIEGKNKKINKKRIKELVQACQLFTSEAKILKCLGSFDTKYKEYVLRFFKELVRNALPGRLWKSAPFELQALHQKFKIEKILNAIEKKQPAQSIAVQINTNDDVRFADWRECNATQFSRAFTYRDCRLIQAIKFSDVTKWLHGQCEQPESVAQLDKTYETTVQWIAFQIVSELDEMRRLEIIQKFLKVGFILYYSDKNFHSASQIAHAFMHPSVIGLLPKEYYCRSEFIDLVSLASDDYDDSKVEIENAFFPINQKFWEGLRSVYSCTYNFNDLALITKYAMKLKNFHAFNVPQLNFRNDDVHSFVSDLEPVPFQTIDELSSFFYAMQGDLKDTRVKLADWDLAHLAHFILKNKNNVVVLDGNTNLSLLKSLYGQGIYNGKQFIDAFSKNKALIESESWPFEKKLAIWVLYLLHLSP